MKKTWQHKASKLIFEHPRITLKEDTVQLPDGQETQYLVYENQADVATVIVVEDDKFLLLHEHTYPLNEYVYQFVEGLIDPGEDWQKAAQRELKEEAGLEAGGLNKIGEILMQHRRTKAVHHVVIARKCREVISTPEHTEDMTNHWFTKIEIMKMIAEGKIIQKNTLAAWSIFLATQS